MTEAVAEVLEEQRNPLRLRANPRVLKRAVPRYPPKRRRHANWPQPTKPPSPELVVIK